FYQHIKCPTRGENTLDHVYSYMKHGYRAIPLHHFRKSDYRSMLFIYADPDHSQNLLQPSLRILSVHCRALSNTPTGTYLNCGNTHSESTGLHTVLYGNCVYQQKRPGFSKPEALDDQPGPLTPQIPQCSLHVGTQSSLQLELRSFFAHFESPQRHLFAPALLPPPSGSITPSVTVKEQNARHVFLAVNPRKSAGPD
ncbi:unnamed protein product, partial [Menidia menidia]